MYKSSKGKRPGRKTPATRALIAERFRILLTQAGLKVPEAAQSLQVTERTVYAWISGKTAVPYSAYRLLRLMHCFELPGRGWEGWTMHSGKLWTPEGFGFGPVDGVWWALLVRQARAFRELYDRSGPLERRLVAAGAAGLADAASEADAAARRAAPADEGARDARRPRAARPNLLLEHFSTNNPPEDGFLGKRVSLSLVGGRSHGLPKGAVHG